MKTYIVHGAPLSGKTTYVNKHKGNNDLIYDFDTLMAALTGLPIHQHNENLVYYVLDIQDMIISRLKSENNIDNVWIITTNISDRFKRSLIGLNAEYIEMKIDIHTAKQRLYDNPGGRNIEVWERVIDKYFTATKDYSSFYKTKEWKRKRQAVLKRDVYQCRECTRYGRVTPADVVHHVNPLQVRPDLKLNEKNLISLCTSHHEAMHNKFNYELSKLGNEWKERTNKRHPEIAKGPPTLEI